MKCITLTLNPAFDRHCNVPNFKLYCEQLAISDVCEAGGKGINISRALCANAVDNLAVVVLGEENQSQFVKALENDGLNFEAICVRGKIRENFTIHTDKGETRISFAGFECRDSLLERVYQILEPRLDSEAIVTFTGRAPSGVSMSAIIAFLERIKGRGARVVIDSKSFASLDELIALRPWLIKPNREEISEYLGREINTHDELVEIADEIRSRGVENVMVSLGEKGALLACASGIYTCMPPKIEAKSTIGAGDSSIGGFLAAIIEGLSEADALCRSVAYGTAACMREGTLPPLPKDICKIIKQLDVCKIK